MGGISRSLAARRCRAFFIAVKETWELRHVQEWESSVFWVLLVLMLLLTLGLTAYRMRRSADLAQRVE